MPEKPTQPREQLELRSPKDLRAHPQAALIPSMTVDEAAGFQADVELRGIMTPLDITEAGVVLDGRHRHRVALALGLEEVPVRIVSPEDEVDYMLAAALQRRHLTPSQRAALAIEHVGYLERRARAAERKKANLRNSGLDVAPLPHRAGRTREYAAKVAGVSPTLIQQTLTIQKRDPARFQQVIAGEILVGPALKQLQREERYAQIGPSPPLPEGTFDLICADPPWQLGSPASTYSPEQHYPTLPTGAICELPVPAADQAALFLWAVTSLLPDALEVVNAWGFTYKTAFVWVKPSIGLGNYARNRHELLLLATRGSLPLPPPERRLDSVLEADRGSHSEKPDRAYELIERMYPGAHRLELFARGKPRAGWKAWGNEVSP